MFCEVSNMRVFLKVLFQSWNLNIGTERRMRKLVLSFGLLFVLRFQVRFSRLFLNRMANYDGHTRQRFQALPFYKLVETVVTLLVTKIDEHPWQPRHYHESFKFVITSKEVFQENAKSIVLVRFEVDPDEQPEVNNDTRLTINGPANIVSSSVVNVTRFVRKSSNCVSVSSEAYPRKLYLCVQVVEKIEGRDLLTYVMNGGAGVQDVAATQALIASLLTVTDVDGTEIDAITVSLLCPLLMTRIVVPCVGLDCGHLQCFDGSSYLRLNESTSQPRWRCPVCNKYLGVDKMRVDLFTVDLLERVPAFCDQIRLSAGGTWEPIVDDVEDVIELDDS